MSDYISKDELKERLVYCRGLGRTSLEAVLKAMDNTPTLDEKEIIRKAFERVVMLLEKELDTADNELKRTIEKNPMQTDFALGYKMAIKNAIGIVRKECGINE